MSGPTVETSSPPPPAVVRRSQRAVARGAGTDRTVLGLLALILLAGGVLVALLGFGVFGAARARRPVLDPMIVDALRTQSVLWRAVAIAAGVVLVVLGLIWVARVLRPERRPDLTLAPLNDGAATTVVVTASALADAIGEQSAELPGVARARARLVGDERAPAVRLTVWLLDGADIGALSRRLESDVLAPARRSLELEHLPVAVRLELDSATPTPRVA